MPSRRDRSTKGPIDVPPIFHGGGGSFTGSADLNQVTAQVVRLEGRLLDLETKRVPDLEKAFMEFRGTVLGAAKVIGFLVAVTAAIAALPKLRH